MTKPRPITAAEKKKILDAQAAGQSCYSIAKDLGRSRSTISRVVTDAGRSFERPDNLKQAHEARVIDNKARRSAIIQRMYRQAEDVLDRLENSGAYKTLVKSGGGAESERVLDFVPPADRRNDLTSAGIAIDKAVALEKVDTDNGAEAAKSMLDRLAEQLQGVPVADLGPDGSSEPEATALPEDQ